MIVSFVPIQDYSCLVGSGQNIEITFWPLAQTFYFSHNQIQEFKLERKTLSLSIYERGEKTFLFSRTSL